MSMHNNSILYWKWDDNIFSGNLQEKVEDICVRTGMENIFIALHWVKRPVSDAELIKTIKLSGRLLHMHHRKLYVELCPRNEGSAFFKEYPGQTAFLTAPTEVHLDHNGTGSIDLNTVSIPHYWRTNCTANEQILASYILVKTGERGFAGDSVREAGEFVSISTDGAGNGNRNVHIAVNAGEIGRERTAVIFVGIPQSIPDLASDNLPEFFAEMLDNFSAGDIDGVCSDEWGYDVWLKINENRCKDRNSLYEKGCFLDHLTYSRNFARYYQEAGGERLLRDLLNLFYVEDGNIKKSITKVNAYHKAFRRIMRKNDEDMYRIAKSKFGADTFFGVHPTWWGSKYLQNFEGFKNGFYWWEAKRDIGQTDENVIMPIRMALAHKWKSTIWYNMWYSMGTRDIDTYYKETWNNVRFGGRTHYLAYECPNEPAVLELKPRGLLENIEKMDAVVRMIDPYQAAPPDCRVLILFGIENSLNWFYNGSGNPPWYPRHNVLYRVLECADRIFGQYLCDLVPTSEIANGSLYMDGNKPRYGSQTYDAVVLLAPDSMEKCCFGFLSRLDKTRLIVAGGYDAYNDGSEMSTADRDVLRSGICFDEILSADNIIKVLGGWGIDENRYKNGCVLQDGSLIFTCEGEKAANNRFVVNVTHGNINIRFEGEDMLYLHRNGSEYVPVYTEGRLELGK